MELQYFFFECRDCYILNIETIGNVKLLAFHGVSELGARINKT